VFTPQRQFIPFGVIRLISVVSQIYFATPVRIAALPAPDLLLMVDVFADAR